MWVRGMKINAVLFDIDGTLIDSNGQHVTARQETFASMVGKGADMLVPTPLPGVGRRSGSAIASAPNGPVGRRRQPGLPPSPSRARHI